MLRRWLYKKMMKWQRQDINSLHRYLENETPKEIVLDVKENISQFAVQKHYELKDIQGLIYGVFLGLFGGILGAYIVEITSKGLEKLNTASLVTFWISFWLFIFILIRVYKKLLKVKFMNYMFQNPTSRKFQETMFLSVAKKIREDASKGKKSS
ncbi:MAG: hypothetical protein KKF65_05640 [Nanoarchaeota archaeon]|nr:hypothetical protein [Nanoarchaeota archaeon]